MIDMDKLLGSTDIALNCPNCGLVHEITLIDMRNRITCDCGRVLASGDNKGIKRMEDLIQEAGELYAKRFLSH